MPLSAPAMSLTAATGRGSARTARAGTERSASVGSNFDSPSSATEGICPTVGSSNRTSYMTVPADSAAGCPECRGADGHSLECETGRREIQERCYGSPPIGRRSTWYWRIWWWCGYNLGFYRLNWWWNSPTRKIARDVALATLRSSGHADTIRHVFSLPFISVDERDEALRSLDALLAENADAKHGQELALLDADNERRIACEARAENQRLRDALRETGELLLDASQAILRWEDSGGATVVHASDYDALLAENQRYEKALEQWLEAEDADDAAIAELHHPDQYGILRRNQERTRAEADAARKCAREALAGDTE